MGTTEAYIRILYLYYGTTRRCRPVPIQCIKPNDVQDTLQTAAVQVLIRP